MKKTILAGLAVLTIVLYSCKKDDDIMTTTPVVVSNGTQKTFTVTVANVFEEKMYFQSGTTNGILPGSSQSFSFNAGIGHYLQFATMFGQSNDLFYAPSDAGIMLYDNSGNPITGDITNQFFLWDAGTEVNEEPGVGPNQAPRQSAPNTGMDENGTVRKISDIMDGYVYPALNTVIKVTLSHNGGTMFTVVIENFSNNATLTTPLAPGVWVVHNQGQMPLFDENTPASIGIQRLAEDGNISEISADLSMSSGYISPFAPGAYHIGSSNEIFTTGQTASMELESLAEDGDPSGYDHIFNMPNGSSSAGPLFPGNSFSFTFTASPNDRLSMASMLGQSNDWFIGLDNIDLFPNGVALSGEISSSAKLYDAGTEVDEYPGVGLNQAPRQNGTNTGIDENGVVSVESTTYNVPTVSDMIQITITAN